MAGFQIILFDVSGTECALRRDSVRELLPLPRLWRPPSLPRPVAGFFNLSGTAVPVIQLDILFSLDRLQADAEDGLYHHLILLDGLAQDQPVALLVDRVQDIVEIDASKLCPVRDQGSLNGCVEAELDFGPRLVHLLSPSRILLVEEQQALAALNRQAQDRLGAWSVTA
ncbi:chemotaxis protein CheW [Microvirga puerhi]|uniref:Chemotaxis protein CheW n=1 Tax=Microvirga puerhi TaxID=2876078 RepID=A0ABS7VQE1_9HYPH|nr:chemotaxis protein CheW [Microvirga puerhi]MBZ6077778.1 chemotaxis protein CheW [Microvirga puerhi]